MYKVNQGPSKFNIYNRSVLTTTQLDPLAQVADSKQTRGRTEVVGNGMSSRNSPKPVFHSPNTTTGNRWPHSHSQSGVPAEHFTPNHLEKVRMLNDAWVQTERELQDTKQSKGRGGSNSSGFLTIEFQNKKNPDLQNFEPMDVEKEELAYMMSNKDMT